MYEPPASYALTAVDTGAISVGDFKKDVRWDVAAAASGGATKIFLGVAPFTTAADVTMGFVAQLYTADFNADSNDDLLSLAGGNGLVFLGKGDGTFQTEKNVVLMEPQGAAIGEYSGDGKLDLVVASSATAALALGNGDGTFGAQSNVVGAGSVFQVVAGDFNNDGMADFAVVGQGPIGPELWVMQGTGLGTFTKKASQVLTSSGRATAVDVTGDGKLDVLVANYTQNTVSVLLGNGDGTFAAKVDYPAGTNPLEAVAGKIDAGSSVDIMVATNEGVSALFQQQQQLNTFAAPVHYTLGARGQRVAVRNFDGVKNDDVVVTVNGAGAVVGSLKLLQNACQ